MTSASGQQKSVHQARLFSSRGTTMMSTMATNIDRDMGRSRKIMKLPSPVEMALRI